MVASSMLRPGPVVSPRPAPLYLLSAALMMIGCYTLSHSLDLHVAAVRKLVTLVLVLDVYELALIALGLYLVMGRRLARDGLILLAIETPFLLDAAFLNSELVAAAGPSGVVAGLGLALVASGKVLLVIRAFKVTIPLPHAIASALALAAVSLGPAWLAFESRAAEPASAQVYVMWWVVAAIAVGHAVCAGAAPVARRGARSVRWPLATLFLVGVYVSLAAHLVALGWVYRVPFHAAYLATVALGLAPWAHRMSPGSAWPLGLPALAILLSLDAPRHLVGSFGVVTISPLRMSLVVAAACYGWFAWGWRSRRLLGLALTCATLAAMGHSVAVMGATVRDAFAIARGLVPRGGVFWGVVSIIAAFGLLVIGAVMNLGRRDPLRQRQR